jgi:uncharacterized protein (TIGR02996 family)
MTSAKDQGERLLRAIIAAPDRDAPRLAYADWLEIQGTPEQRARAEVIRLQILQAATAADDPRQDAWRTRESGLRYEYVKQWLSALPRWARSSREWWRRGFLYAVTGTVGQFLTDAEHLRRTFPLEELYLHRLENQARLLFACPHLVGLKILAFRGLVGTDTVELARCPYLAGLSGLYLRYVRDLGPSGAKALADSPHLARLTHLELHGGGIGDAGARALARSRHLTRLAQLVVTESAIGPAGARALAGSAIFAKLEVLSLNGNKIGDAGLTALVGSPHLKRLRRLCVAHAGITAAVFSELAEWRGSAKLQELALSGNRIGDRGAVVLAGSRWVRTLKRLSLAERGITSVGVKALKASPYLAQLDELWMDGRLVGGRAATPAAKQSKRTALREEASDE